MSKSPPSRTMPFPPLSVADVPRAIAEVTGSLVVDPETGKLAGFRLASGLEIRGYLARYALRSQLKRGELQPGQMYRWRAWPRTDKNGKLWRLDLIKCRPHDGSDSDTDWAAIAGSFRPQNGRWNQSVVVKPQRANKCAPFAIAFMGDLAPGLARPYRTVEVRCAIAADGRLHLTEARALGVQPRRKMADFGIKKAQPVKTKSKAVKTKSKAVEAKVRARPPKPSELRAMGGKVIRIG